ncbi:hypothetical protein D3C71_1968510 [compost metagenome]
MASCTYSFIRHIRKLKYRYLLVARSLDITVYTPMNRRHHRDAQHSIGPDDVRRFIISSELQKKLLNSQLECRQIRFIISPVII